MLLLPHRLHGVRLRITQRDDEGVDAVVRPADDEARVHGRMRRRLAG